MLEKHRLMKFYQKLRKIYCSTIGVEYMHISDPEEKIWFRHRLENGKIKLVLLQMEKKQFLIN